jgi:hypothetical protein
MKSKTMEFAIDVIYWFSGSVHLVENRINNERSENDNVFLGKFIAYIGFPVGSDWLNDAKAQFEYGTISRGYYDKIHT